MIVNSRIGVIGLAAIAAVMIASCTSRSTEPTVQRFTKGNYPELLSEWQLLTATGSNLSRASDTQIYRINTPLFSDYTQKLRTLSLPTGTQATYREQDTLDFPVGTVISKTFYYDTRDVPLDHRTEQRNALFEDSRTISHSTKTVRLLETRLLVHDQTGWQALPYVWNDAQTDALLSVTGAIKTIGENFYVVPSRDECGSCHAVGRDKVLMPIGPKARHLHAQTSGAGESANSANSTRAGSLRALIDRGWLAPPADLNSIIANARWDSALRPASLDDNQLEHRARSYLDANCGHCHNPQGSADTSHLYLDYANHSARSLGQCKPPVAAGRGTGGHLFSIVPGNPENSILSYRMRSTDPGKMMPETGRTRVHTEGVALIDEWIRRKTGECL